MKYFDITQLINEVGKGRFLVEANETLASVVRDCLETGKKGAIAITIQIEPVPSKDGDQLKIIPNVTGKNPRFAAAPNMFFVVTNDKKQPVGLDRDDPKQAHLFAEKEGH